MDAIIVRCKMCKHAMKFSAEKAGKRAKCPKCDAIVLIKAEEEAKKPEPAPVAAAPDAPAAAPPDDDEDSTGGYEVYLDPEIERRRKAMAEEEERARKKKDKKNLPKVGRKVKAIPDAELWDKTRVGMIFLALGCAVWLIAHLLQGSYLLVGSNEYPEFAVLVAERIEHRADEGLPEDGGFWDIDFLRTYLGMMSGRAFTTFAVGCIRIASLLTLVQIMLMGVGYLFYLPVPRRFGMFGQALVVLALVALNFLFMFIFKLLPVLGVHSYILIPFVIPEIALAEYNMERVVPIHVMWSGAGWPCFFENLFNFFLRGMQYLEPAFGCIFLWTMGVAIKDEEIAARGKGLTQMCLGTLFVLLCFHLLSLCGASPVLVWLLRVLYALWFFFLTMFIVSYAVLLLKCRSVLYEKINPQNELKDDKDQEADDEDDDEDEEDD
jgi:hypothetical protein